MAATLEPQSEFDYRPLPDPGKAAQLSLIPGLGQFYNGQKRKGVLFLAAFVVSLLVFITMFFGPSIYNAVTPIAALLNLKPNVAMAESMTVSPSVIVISFLLFFSFIAYAVRDAYDHAAFLQKRVAGPRLAVGLAETTSGSYLVHFAIISYFLVALLFLIAPKPPSEQITDIQLMPEQHRAAPSNKPKNNPPPKPKAPPPPKPVVVPPKAVTPPVKVKPQPTPPPISVKSNEPSPNMVPATPSAPAPAATTTGSGSGMAGDDSAGDDQEVDFGPYLAAMQRRIKKAWFPPKGNESKRVTLKFDIQRDGSVTNVRMAMSSGLAVADDAAIAAVQNAAPFAPLPKGAPDELNIKFTFDYNVFNGTTRGAFHQF